MILKNGMDRSIYLLLMLYADDQAPVEGTLKLQKLMFLLEKELIEKGKRLTSEHYSYVPYKYGPMSTDLYDEIEMLLQHGLIEVSGKNDKRKLTTYKITERVRVLVENFLKDNKEAQTILKEIERLKKRFNKLSNFALLNYVYAKYPLYAVKSEIAMR